MPLLLNTPLDMGAVDNDYTHVKIIMFHYTETHIQLNVRHGTVSGNDFVPGVSIAGVTDRKFVIDGEDYTAIVGTLTSAEGVSVYDEVANALYQWLIDEGHYTGSIV